MKQQDDWHLTGDIDHEMGRGDPFAAAIRGTRMSMIITDPRQPDNPIVFANAAFQKLTGYDREEIIGRNCRFLQGPLTDPHAVVEIREAIAAERDLQIDILNYRKDGSSFCISARQACASLGTSVMVFLIAVAGASAAGLANPALAYQLAFGFSAVMAVATLGFIVAKVR